MRASQISVVIATRDRAAILQRTLRHLCALPERPPVLVVDNASTDRTRAMVTEGFPQVRLLALPVNRGALARNAGVRAVETPFVAFSDDDSWWQPGSLATAVRLMHRHPGLGLLAAHTRVEPDGGCDPLNTVLAASPLGRPPGWPGPWVLGFLGCAAIARRSAFLETGGYHPLLFFGAEETLLAYDLAAHGWGVAYCPQVVARHAPVPGGRADRHSAVLRNELLTAWLRRPLPLALGRTRTLALAALRGDEDARRALRSALSRIPSALRDRRRLPPWVESAARQVEGNAGAGRAGFEPARTRRRDGAHARR